MSDFTYELLYTLEAITNIGFRIAVVYLIIQYLKIRSLKQ